MEEASILAVSSGTMPGPNRKNTCFLPGPSPLAEKFKSDWGWQNNQPRLLKIRRPGGRKRGSDREGKSDPLPSPRVSRFHPVGSIH